MRYSQIKKITNTIPSIDKDDKYNPDDPLCEICNKKGHLSTNCPTKFKYKSGARIPTDIFRTIKGARGFSKYLLTDNFNVTKERVKGHDERVTFPFDPLKSFKDADFHSALTRNLEEKLGYAWPTNIQRCVIPIVKLGYDVLARSETGSGKTVAILAPVIDKLLTDREHAHFDGKDTGKPICLLVSPTRELCLQLHKNALALSYGTDLNVSCVYAGFDDTQLRRHIQRTRCDMVIGTVARIQAYIEQRVIDVSRCKYFLVDEADIMITSNFIEAFEYIISRLPPSYSSDKDTCTRQTIMFGATLSSKHDTDFKKYTWEIVYVKIGLYATAGIELTIQRVNIEDKRDHVVKLIEDIMKKNDDYKVMIFVNTINQCIYLHDYFIGEGYKNVNKLHSFRKVGFNSDKDIQKKKEDILYNFTNDDKQILICTDLTSRGLDINGVTLIIQYDIPFTIESYIQRNGRTGRVGNLGYSISLFDPIEDNFEERPYMKHDEDGEQKLMSQQIINVLGKCTQEVPDWLLNIVNNSGKHK